SAEAARGIGIYEVGTGPVEIATISTAGEAGISAGTGTFTPDYFSGNFTIQIGAFSEKSNAEKLIQRLSQTYKNVHMVSYHDGNKIIYRVRVGEAHTLEKAVEYETHMIRNGFPDAFVVAE
ncbi:MAG: SPOR domain-containing protein, partial [Thermodesulfobacteriota bacterium]